MADLGSLVVRLEANMASFNQNMEEAARRTQATMGKIQGAAKVAAVAVAAVGVGLAINAIVNAATKAVDALAELDDMAQKTGASVENLSRLSKVAEMTGTEFAKVDGAITKLAKGMATADEKGSKFNKAMQALGISTQDIANQDPAALFVEISNKLQGYADGAGKVAVATELMGKSGAEMLPYMNDVAENIDKFSGVSAEAAANASRYQDSLGQMRVEYNELTTALATALLPAAADFIGALTDLKNGSDGVSGVDIAGWADSAAIGFARVADIAMTLPKIFKAVSGSVKVVMADINVAKEAASVSPFGMAKNLYEGKDAFENVKKAVKERNKVLADANQQYSDLFNKPLNQMEAALNKRMAARKTGSAATPATVRPQVSFGGDPASRAAPKSAGKSEQAKALEAGAAMVENLKRQEGALGLTGAALLAYNMQWDKASEAQIRAAVASQSNIEAFKAEQEAVTAIANNMKADADMRQQAADKNRADVEAIRQSLLSEVERENEIYALRLDSLAAYQDGTLESTIIANQLLEEENARHEQALADMRAAHNLNMLGMMGNSADQLYGLMKQAGMEQTALGKAVFLASKAIAVAEIIINTEVAAAKAQAQFGAFGIPIATGIRVAGYAAAGLVAGMAIAEASAEGGYDIPAGKNPMTQLHEREMVLPRAQADVIRGLASGGGGAGKVEYTIINQTTGRIDSVQEQVISPTQRALIIREAVMATASEFSDPNSKTSRSMSRNFNVPRTR